MLLKGNLHTHTTRTDGRKTPGEAIALYAQHGYDFIALTDHYVYNPACECGGMTVISGVEYDTGTNAKDGIWHIVALGMKDDPGLTREPSKPDVRTIIRTIKEHGGTVDLAHPAWSMNRPDEMLSLAPLGIDCTEIYNTVSGVPFNCRPYSGGIVDMLALGGWYPPCIAVDDTHFYEGEECRSYILADCEDRSQESILKSVREGRFIATQGPEFTVNADGGTVTVECTPCERIVFYTDTLYVGDRVTRGSGITKATYYIKPTDTFVRVELTDEQGRMGWSRAIKVRS